MDSWKGPSSDWCSRMRLMIFIHAGIAGFESQVGDEGQLVERLPGALVA